MASCLGEAGIGGGVVARCSAWCDLVELSTGSPRRGRLITGWVGMAQRQIGNTGEASAPPECERLACWWTRTAALRFLIVD